MYKAQIKLSLKFLKFILPYRKRWLWILILSNATALVSLLNPYLTKLVIDEGIGKKDLKLFILLALIGGSVFLLNELLSGIKNFLERYIKTRVDFDLNKKLYKHTQNLSFNWFSDKSTGEHLYKIDYDISTITDFITNTLPHALFTFTKLLFTLAIIFYLNWRMALFSLVLAPFLYIPSYYFSRKITKVCEDLIRNSEDIYKNLEESFSHIKLIKVFGKEISNVRHFLKKLIINIRVNIKTASLGIFSASTIQLATKVIIGLISFYGGYQVIRGHLSLGSLTAITIYLFQLIGLQNQFAFFFQTITIGLISCRRISEILEERPQVIEVKDAKNVSFEKGQVIFKNISFGYKPKEYILKNMSFCIEGGSHIAVVGPSGCGKTTLLNLLIRLYDPWEGEILIDGYNISGLKLKALKEQLGFALQEAFLWNDNIENNIRYGKEGAAKEEILRIAQLAGVDDFVKDLPGSYQTVIGENACKISEGQKQKIAIARALIKQPKILILDEAMSSMDSSSEEGIISNIKRTQKDLTLITVSHRLSTVMRADLVYYFFRPNEMVIDKADNLFEYNREFAHLFASQNKILI